jgi:hypothetical protein
MLAGTATNPVKDGRGDKSPGSFAGQTADLKGMNRIGAQGQMIAVFFHGTYRDQDRPAGPEPLLKLRHGHGFN